MNDQPEVRPGHTVYRGYRISVTKWDRKVDPYMPIVETPKGGIYIGDLNASPGKATQEGRQLVDGLILKGIK